MRLEPKVSIVIASYNTRELLRRCIQSIADATRLTTYEMIVVDNNSSDGSREMLTEVFPWVRLLCNSANAGFAAAQNRGLMEARGRFCLVLNSDVIFKEDAISSLVTFMETAPVGTGAVGPCIRNRDGSLAPSARRVNTSGLMLALSIINRHFAFSSFIPQHALRRWVGPGLGRLHDNFAPHDSVVEAGYLDGMCVMIRREVLEQAGLFDEQFFFDFEIIDWSIRVRRKGWKLLYFPGAYVIHLGHGSRRLVRQIVVETHRSELIYFAKHFPEQIPLIRVVVRAVVGLRYVIARVHSSFAPNASAQALQIYRGILELARSFDCAAVDKNGSIPAMPHQSAPRLPVRGLSTPRSGPGSDN